MRARSIAVLLCVVLSCAALAGTASAAPLGPFSCLPANGLSSYNPPDKVMSGIVTIPGYSSVNIGTSGNVNWALNPYSDPSWQRWFHSLKWLEPTILSYMRTGDAAQGTRIQAIAHDWINDNPLTVTRDVWLAQIAGLRATTLVCLANAVGLPSWLSAGLTTHGGRLADPRYYAGPSNQGLDQAIGLLGVGCVLGRRDWGDTAVTRMAKDVGVSIDAQGATNEQAPGYSSYVYDRWTLAKSKIDECNYTVPASISSRLTALPSFIAHSMQPNGTFAQIGDSFATAPSRINGTPVEYAVTQGASGPKPAEEVRVYDAGYVFGRTGWGESRPFTAESFYSIHYGPTRNYHGHQDHTSLTYYTRGRNVLVDAGHDGYLLDNYRKYLMAPEGHNVLAVTGARLLGAATSMVRKTILDKSQFYEMTGKPYEGVARTRGVLVVENPGFIVVYDRATSTVPVTFTQLWHLAPDFVAKRLTRNSIQLMTSDSQTQVFISNVLFPGQTAPAGGTLVKKGATSPYQGWLSRKLHERVQTPAVLMPRGGKSARMLSVFVPARTTAGISTSLTLGADGWYTLIVKIGLDSYRVRISGGGYMAAA